MVMVFLFQPFCFCSEDGVRGGRQSVVSCNRIVHTALRTAPPLSAAAASHLPPALLR